MTNKRKLNIVMWLKKAKDKQSRNFQGKKSAAYHAFFKRASERHNFYFAYEKDSYRGEGVFRPVNIYDDGNIVSKQKEVVADVIYQFKGAIAKPGFDPSPATITNTPEFREFCASKIDTVKYLKDYFPETYLIHSRKEFKKTLAHITTEKVAIKPNRGSNGKNVFVLGKEGVIDISVTDEELEKGFLVQEFIDTKSGIEGVCKSSHDLRIITLNNEISLVHVRTPKDGSLISNSHRGAIVREISVGLLPQEVIDFYKAVHSKITKKYPLPMYSMDIGMDAQKGPMLIELNPHTAFPADDFDCFDLFIENLIAHLENASKRS